MFLNCSQSLEFQSRFRDEIFSMSKFLFFAKLKKISSLVHLSKVNNEDCQNEAAVIFFTKKYWWHEKQGNFD